MLPVSGTLNATGPYSHEICTLVAFRTPTAGTDSSSLEHRDDLSARWTRAGKSGRRLATIPYVVIRCSPNHSHNSRRNWSAGSSKKESLSVFHRVNFFVYFQVRFTGCAVIVSGWTSVCAINLGTETADPASPGDGYRRGS